MNHKKISPPTTNGNISQKIESLNHDDSIISKDQSFSKENTRPLLNAQESIESSNSPALSKEVFMTPFTAFSTIINIVLATGPFT